jgi:hypothetical protein
VLSFSRSSSGPMALASWGADSGDSPETGDRWPKNPRRAPVLDPGSTLGLHTRLELGHVGAGVLAEKVVVLRHAHCDSSAILGSVGVRRSSWDNLILAFSLYLPGVRTEAAENPVLAAKLVEDGLPDLGDCVRLELGLSHWTVRLVGLYGVE